MVFHWSLSDSKSSQVSRSLLSILADLNNVVVWIVATRPVISKSTSPCTNPLVTLPRAPITIGITVTFMFHSFFFFPWQGPSFRFLWILFYALPGEQSPQFGKFSFFLLNITRSGCLAEIRWSVCMSKSKSSLCVSFSWTDSLLCIHHLFI